jgi:energy-coupling factor transporter ATP-binding protein EcfA2
VEAAFIRQAEPVQAASDLSILWVIPDSAAPGERVVVALSQPVGDPAAVPTVFFGEEQATVDRVEQGALHVVVPPRLEPGSRPAIVVQIGDRRTGAFGGFTVSPPAGGPWFWGAEALIAALFAAGVILVAVLAARYLTRIEVAETPPVPMASAGRAAPAGTTPASDAATPPGDRVPLPDLPNRLIEACTVPNCVLFAGPGVAAQAALPTRFEALAALVDELGRAAPTAGLERALDEERLDLVAETLQKRLGPDQIHALLRKMYPPPSSSRDLPDLHRHLASVPFTAALTTNWDDLLMSTFADREPLDLTPDSPMLEQVVRDERFFVGRLAGSLDFPGSLLLTERDVQLALYGNRMFQRLLTTLVRSRSLLFLGTSLPGIESFMERLTLTEDSVRHYAIVPIEDLWDLKREQFSEKLGVELLGYSPTDGHPEVVELIRRLAEQVSAASAGVTAGAARPASNRLDAVRLRNIGAFEDLALELGGGWNVILGNNGSGKSTILKAIALGLCGDDPTAAAAGPRLLRAKADRGFIELQVGNTRYRTDLIREPSGVRIESGGLTPVQAGRWVVLGFPALRGVSTRNPQGPTGAGPGKPQVRDLLPLLLGDVDSRLDDLKQWMVNAWVRGSDPAEKVAPGYGVRSAPVIEAFFGVIKDLTPGMQIALDGVDTHSWEVFVTTDDGRIPIDQISQGMSSIVGWVGTLVQRMFEIYPDDMAPTGREALVLVDEIDAHLHPAWQRALRPLMGKHFGSLQMVATTHSPLVVAGMSSEEVLIARRDGPAGTPPRVAPSPLEFSGMRADQILTSPLFGLGTTRGTREQADIDRYADLLGRDDRTPVEEAEYRTLRAKMDRWMSGGETKMERQVERAVRDALEGIPEPGSGGAEDGTPEVTPEMDLEIRRRLAQIFHPDSTL